MILPRASFVPVVGLLVACGGDRSASGDEFPLRLSGGPVCNECRIELRELATLGHPDDPASVRPDAPAAGCMVGALEDGTYVVSGAVGGGRILVYGREGRVSSSIGREGSGPGEFGSDLRLTTRGDTLIVVDNSNRRIVKIDRSGNVLGSFRLPMRVNSFARLTSGSYLLHARPSTGPGQALFVLVDAEGAQVARFGRTERELWDTDQWVVSPGESAPYWAASMWSYRLFRGWGDSLATAVIRDVEWFPPDNVWSREILETEPAPPLVTYLHETDDQLLWVFITVADPEWTPDLPDVGSAEWRRDAFDTRIEVIDLAAGRVLAGHRSDDYLGGVCGKPLVYAITPAPGGHVQVRVFQPRLER